MKEIPGQLRELLIAFLSPFPIKTMVKLSPHNHKVPSCFRENKPWVLLSPQDLRKKVLNRGETQGGGQRSVVLPEDNLTTVLSGQQLGMGHFCFMSTNIYEAHTLINVASVPITLLNVYHFLLGPSPLLHTPYLKQALSLIIKQKDFSRPWLLKL